MSAKDKLIATHRDCCDYHTDSIHSLRDKRALKVNCLVEHLLYRRYAFPGLRIARKVIVLRQCGLWRMRQLHGFAATRAKIAKHRL